MNAEAVYFGADAGFQAVFHDDITIDRGRVERAVKLARALIRYRTKHGTGGISGMAGERQILLDQTLGSHMHGNEANLVALALDHEMQHALAALNIAHAQPA